VIKNNKLDAKNKLKLVGFEMASVEKLDKQGKNNSKDEYQKSKSQGFNSMGLALNMLRDKDNNIDLDVPVKGDLSSPDFEAKSVINTALMSALKGSTKVALALSLQPYGAIYLASKYAIDKASEVSLQPVEFLPGKTTVKPDMSAYLTKIAELMKSKKKLHIKICGFYNLQDKKAMVGLKLSEDKLKNKLYQLAEQRQEKVKNWLVTKGGVATKNLVTCHPEFQDQKPSGVNLLM
jgi:outer membrane protein OmpA-like peptidoglycan-associated protein